MGGDIKPSSSGESPKEGRSFIAGLWGVRYQLEDPDGNPIELFEPG
jgi:hypothetical protein